MIFYTYNNTDIFYIHRIKPSNTSHSEHLGTRKWVALHPAKRGGEAPGTKLAKPA